MHQRSSGRRRVAGDSGVAELRSWGELSGAEVVATLDQITDGIAVLGPDWRFRYVNGPAAEMLRKTRQELLGRTLWSQFPDFEQGRPFHLAFEQSVREQQPFSYTDRYAPLGRWFETRGFPQDENLVVLFRDITEERLTEDRAREHGERMAEAEQVARFGIWRWDLASGTVTWSDELHRIYGIERESFGGTLEAFVANLHPDDRDSVAQQIEQALVSGEPFELDERIKRPDGTERVLHSWGRVLADGGGEPVALVGLCIDVTEHVEARLALGLSEQRVRAIIDHTPSIVSVKDLDGRYLMANDECARVLGLPVEEIIGEACSVLFPEVSERQRANDAETVETGEPVYDEAVLVRDGEPRTYVTVTFALPDQAGRAVETCTIGTDVTERRERESERRERLEWVRRIESALADERLLVFAQPVISIATGDCDGYELLVRMRPDGEPDSILEPAAFLPAAERYGLIQSIDLWMVRNALQLASRFSPTVNLSAITLGDADAREEIVELLAREPQPARRLVFEITETASAEHLEAAISFASDLTALGCGLALDDFGTGFGSFIYLRKLPLRYLKIDRSFVLDLTRSQDDQRIVQSIISIAAQFGLRTISEGVEDERTLELLRTLGTDYVQGFHLGRPAPVDSVVPPAG